MNEPKIGRKPMKKFLGRFGLVALAAFSVLTVAAYAETLTAPKRVAPAPRYEIGKEVTLDATVTKVLKAGNSGMLAGGHLMLSTSKGVVDGHLGPFALRGRNAISVSAGEHLKVVGVMTTYRNSNVFLVRTVESGSQTYTIRNEHGFPIIQGATQPTHQLGLVKGGQR
jgi:hypothetical protein